MTPTDLARREFKRALRAHIKAIHRAYETDIFLSRAQNRLYLLGIRIDREWSEAGLDPADVELTLRTRQAINDGRVPA